MIITNRERERIKKNLEETIRLLGPAETAASLDTALRTLVYYEIRIAVLQERLQFHLRNESVDQKSKQYKD